MYTHAFLPTEFLLSSDLRFICDKITEALFEI